MPGNKLDQGKPRFDLIPPHPVEALADLYGIGAAKYGDRNWEQGFKWGRPYAAMLRHAWAWWRGETHDPTDGQHHLIAVAWNAFTLYEHERRNLGEDDRKPTPIIEEYPDFIEFPPGLEHDLVRIGDQGRDYNGNEWILLPEGLKKIKRNNNE